MAKLSSVNKNNRRIKLSNRFFNKRSKLKKIIMDKKIPLEERFKAQQKLSKLPRNSAKNRVMNRCQITGRPHGVYRKLKISRIALRQLGLQGKIPGLVKSSWKKGDIMSLSDPIGDMIARVKNAQARYHKKVDLPSSNFKSKIADILKNEGFIKDFKISSNENKNILSLELKYHSGNPVINNFERVSKPGRRIFSSADSLPKINNGLGIAILSTPKGVMTDIDARKQRVGGEIICKVF